MGPSRRLTPHVLALANHDHLPQANVLDWLFNQASDFLTHQAQTKPAILLAEKSLELTIGLHGPDHRETGVGHSVLGQAYREDGQLQQAERALAEAVRIGEALPDRQDDLAVWYSNHGGVLMALGETDKAEERYKTALQIHKDIHGERSRQVGTRLNNLASLYNKIGNRSTAIEHTRDALSIEQAQTPPDLALLGYRQNNLGAVLLENGDLEEAEELLAKAFETRCVAYENPAHPLVVGTANWYVIALLMRAARGINPGMRQAKAKTICGDHGLVFEHNERDAQLRLAALDAGIEFKDFIARLMAKAEADAQDD